MARPYSLDLRERVVASVVSGQPCRAVSALFDVSVASVVKWSQRARATESAAAKPMGGKRPYLLEKERDWLLARLAEKPPRRTRPARRHGLLRHALALPQTRGISFKKNRLRRRAEPA